MGRLGMGRGGGAWRVGVACPGPGYVSGSQKLCRPVYSAATDGPLSSP
jgi:hypothetical protein